MADGAVTISCQADAFNQPDRPFVRGRVNARATADRSLQGDFNLTLHLVREIQPHIRRPARRPQQASRRIAIGLAGVEAQPLVALIDPLQQQRLGKVEGSGPRRKVLLLAAVLRQEMDFFHWTAEIVEHLDDNDVTPEEFEAVVQDNPRMTAEQRQQFEQALAEEQIAKAANIEAAAEVLPRLIADCEQAAGIVRQLREARETAGVSLAELEQRTGIRKSVLSRLENSKAPNPTLATLQRYCEALGKRVAVLIEDESAN